MITAYLASRRRPTSQPLAKAIASKDVVWIDILNGSEAELAEVHKLTGLDVPSLASLSEIEHSSRMRREGDAVVLSLPLPRPNAKGIGLLPIGFVLSSNLLLTVRFD